FFAGFGGAIAAALLAFAGYISSLFPALGELGARLLAITTLWMLTAAHLGGMRLSGKLQTVLAAVTVMMMVAFIMSGFAIGHGTVAHFRSSAVPRGSMAVSLIFVLYAYSGWNAAAYLAGEIVEPEHGLPRALIVGTVCVGGLYVALNALYLWALPISEMSGVMAIAERAAVKMFWSRGTRNVTALIALAILSSSAMVVAGPRVYFAMAHDGVFPRAFAIARGRSGPTAAIVLQSAWASFLILAFRSSKEIVVYPGVAITIVSAAAVAAVIVIRMQRPR